MFIHAKEERKHTFLVKEKLKISNKWMNCCIEIKMYKNQNIRYDIDNMRNIESNITTWNVRGPSLRFDSFFMKIWNSKRTANAIYSLIFCLYTSLFVNYFFKGKTDVNQNNRKKMWNIVSEKNGPDIFMP